MNIIRFAKNAYEPVYDLVRLPVAISIFIVSLAIVSSYTFYVPPNFEEGFLVGRKSYFFATPYAIGFYAHIIGAPIALISGTFQLNRHILQRLPRLHRILGRITIFSTMLLASPGGLIMAFGTNSGRNATLCFVLMSLLTFWFACMTWRTAVARNFKSHRRWASRCYVMLSSAIVLRVIDLFLRGQGVPGPSSYGISIWLSWLPGMLVLEILNHWSVYFPRPSNRAVECQPNQPS